MTDYSLRPRLEEALSRGRIPGLSREEALTLDPDYRTKVGEAVIDLASRNIKDCSKIMEAHTHQMMAITVFLIIIMKKVAYKIFQKSYR